MTLKQLEREAARRAQSATRYWRPPSEWPWTQDIEHPINPDWLAALPREKRNGYALATLETTSASELVVVTAHKSRHELSETYLREKYAWIHAKLIRVGTSAQWTAVVQLVQSYCAPGEVQNLQIIAPTGAGKSYVIAAFLHIVMEEMPGRFRIPGRMLPVVIEPPKVVPQMYQILAEFRVAALVTSLASLRATLGESMLEWKTVVVNQQPTLYPFWRMDCATTLIVVDESQQVKNEDSSQSTIIESAAGHGIPILPVSATPYSRISQGKIIACAVRPWIEFGGVKMRLSPKIWKSWASDLTPPGYAITDWTPKGLKRFQEHLEPYTVRFSVPYKHKIITALLRVNFHQSARAVGMMTRSKNGN